MVHITIFEPIWKNRSIGVDVAKIKDALKIDIVYKTSEGKRLYPDTYTISKDSALNYPKQLVRGGVTVSLIPIEDLDILPERKYTQDELDEIEYYRTQNLPIPNHLRQ